MRLVVLLFCSCATLSELSEGDRYFLKAAEEALDSDDLKGAIVALRKATQLNPARKEYWVQLREVLEDYRIELNIADYPLLDAEDPTLNRLLLMEAQHAGIKAAALEMVGDLMTTATSSSTLNKSLSFRLWYLHHHQIR